MISTDILTVSTVCIYYHFTPDIFIISAVSVTTLTTPCSVKVFDLYQCVNNEDVYPIVICSFATKLSKPRSTAAIAVLQSSDAIQSLFSLSNSIVFTPGVVEMVARRLDCLTYFIAMFQFTTSNQKWTTLYLVWFAL